MLICLLISFWLGVGFAALSCRFPRQRVLWHILHYFSLCLVFLPEFLFFPLNFIILMVVSIMAFRGSLNRAMTIAAKKAQRKDWDEAIEKGLM